MDNPWKPACIVFMILFALAFILGISGAYNSISNPSLFSSTVSKETTAQKAVDYISANYLAAGVTAKLVSVTEESGLYKVSIKFSSSQGDQVSSMYMTRDGKYLFPSAYPMTMQTTGSATSGKTVAESCTAQSKQEDAALEVFVVSYCPYGTQMQGVLADVVTGVPDLAKNIRVLYLGQVTNGTIRSMHGSTEAAENLRQICIREEQPEIYWKYVACFINSSSAADCLKATGVDTAKLGTCTSSQGHGLAYAQEDFARADSYGATGSPTLILNGVRVSEFNFGGRNPEAVKTLLCCGFTSQPGSCSTVLSNVTAGRVSAASC